ncbi:hypothetical protein LPJ63_005026, partial [Coemansia sp. RSA 2711]
MGSTDFSKYTHINVAFSIPNEDGTFSFEDDWALPQITRQARSGGAQVLMSVGGWTGSNHFSNILKSESKRQTLLNSMRDYLKKNELDGIDIDWEYPGRQGNTCNAVDAGQDTPNFLAFLKDLRQLFTGEFGERKKLITLAVRVQPFDINGSPTSDVSEFAQYVDYVNIMAYDINGPWNPDTGPNAPFNYEESKGTPLSFVSGINAWLDAGMPANKLVAGLGFYGRSTIAQQDMQRVPSQYQPQLHDVPLGDPEDAPWYDKCAGTTSASGTWQWKHLRTQGILTDFTTAAAPWVRQWDKVSQTPWLFHPEKKLFLSYDDPESIRIKSDYAASKGLAGVMLWSINMDHNSELIDAASSFGRSGNNSTLTVASMALALVAPVVIGGPVVLGYYPSWKKAQMAGVDFGKYTHITMAFAIPTSSGTFSFDGDWFLPQVVSDLHSKGTKVLMSVGGWTGSNYFSTILKSDSTSNTLIQSMVDYVKQYDLDGIDIDWEYPG